MRNLYEAQKRIGERADLNDLLVAVCDAALLVRPPPPPKLTIHASCGFVVICETTHGVDVHVNIPPGGWPDARKGPSIAAPVV